MPGTESGANKHDQVSATYQMRDLSFALQRQKAMCYSTPERFYCGVFLLHEPSYLAEGNGGMGWGGWVRILETKDLKAQSLSL